MGDDIKRRLEAHAAACRAALSDGRQRPAWVGGSLWRADLRSADLRDAILRDADLRSADLRGAAIYDGVAAAAVGECDGGYYWHAVRLADGGCILQYGCDRASLEEWRSRGPEYGARHHHLPEHWAIGPAVAIAAAEALAAERGA